MRRVSTAAPRSRNSGRLAADLAALLDSERVARDQELTVALLKLRDGGAQENLQGPADRLLRQAAPWALDPGGALLAMRPPVADRRNWALFRAWSSWRSPRSLQQLAADNGISAQRAGRIAHDVAAGMRAELHSAPASLRWIVDALGHHLGSVAEHALLDTTLAQLGAAGRAAEVLVWLAGPYHRLPQRPGWLAREPAAIVGRTAMSLSTDGGVRQLSEVEAELGLSHEQSAAWLRVNQATIVFELSVSLAGALPSVIERILDAHGRPLAVPAIIGALADGGRPVAEPSVERALRRGRFPSSPTGEFGLPGWSDEAGTSRTCKSKAVARVPAGPARTERRPRTSRYSAGVLSQLRSAPGEPLPSGERLWLRVRVDGEVLRGAEGVVPAALVEGLGVVAATRRSFSSRYGPIVLAFDGPEPVRGTVRAITLAAGAHDGDALLLGFSRDGDVAVEVHRGTDQSMPPDPVPAASHFLTGGSP